MQFKQTNCQQFNHQQEKAIYSIEEMYVKAYDILQSSQQYQQSIDWVKKVLDIENHHKKALALKAKCLQITQTIYSQICYIEMKKLQKYFFVIRKQYRNCTYYEEVLLHYHIANY